MENDNNNLLFKAFRALFIERRLPWRIQRIVNKIGLPRRFGLLGYYFSYIEISVTLAVIPFRFRHKNIIYFVPDGFGIGDTLAMSPLARAIKKDKNTVVVYIGIPYAADTAKRILDFDYVITCPDMDLFAKLEKKFNLKKVIHLHTGKGFNKLDRDIVEMEWAQISSAKIDDKTIKYKLTKTEENKAKRLKKKYGDYLIFATECSTLTDKKRWPDKYWQELIDLQTLPVVIVGTGKGAYFGNCIDLRDKTTKYEMAALIKSCKLFTGLSSGPLWYARAFDKDAIAIVGGYELPENTGYGKCYYFSYSPECYLCGLDPKKVCMRDMECMRRIMPEAVNKKIKEMLGSHSWGDNLRSALTETRRRSSLYGRTAGRIDLKYIYYRLYEKRILFSKPVVCDKNSEHEIHIVTCRRDAICALWSLKSFYHFSRLRAGLVIHDDGSLTDGLISRFKEHFIGCDIIRKRDADLELRRHLKDYEFCNKYRFENVSPAPIKLFDFFFVPQPRGGAITVNPGICPDHVSKKILILDSDVLFFREPLEMLAYMKNGQGYFMSDYRDSYSFSVSYLTGIYNMEIRNKVNSGIIYFSDRKIYDLSLIESFLRMAYENPEQIKDSHRFWWLDQTIWAILLSKHREKFARLPDAYQVGNNAISGKTVSHHFVGGGRQGDFYKRGLKQLKKIGFIRRLNQTF